MLGNYVNTLERFISGLFLGRFMGQKGMPNGKKGIPSGRRGIPQNKPSEQTHLYNWRLREARLELGENGYTAERVAVEIGIPVTTLYACEQLRLKPGEALIGKIVEYYGKTKAELFPSELRWLMEIAEEDRREARRERNGKRYISFEREFSEDIIDERYDEGVRSEGAREIVGEALINSGLTIRERKFLKGCFELGFERGCYNQVGIELGFNACNVSAAVYDAFKKVKRTVESRLISEDETLDSVLA